MARLMQKLDGNAHDVVAARQHSGRQGALLGAQHVGRAQRVAEARQVDRLVQQLHPDQPAPVRQRQLVDLGPVVMRQVLAALGGIGARLQRLVGGADGEGEAGAEPVRGAHQVAEVQRLRDALGADGEIAARKRRRRWLVHGSLPLRCQGVRRVATGAARCLYLRIGRHYCREQGVARFRTPLRGRGHAARQRHRGRRHRRRIGPGRRHGQGARGQGRQGRDPRPQCRARREARQGARRARSPSAM